MAELIKCLQNVRVLCVDDNRDSLTLLSAVLTRNGALATTCLSAAAALEQLKLATFDVIVSDIAMPEMDGFDFVHELRAMERGTLHRTPTVALSGQAGQANPKRRFADFQIYLYKPFDRKKLVEVVRRLAEADGEAVGVGTLALWEADQVAAVPRGDEREIDRGR